MSSLEIPGAEIDNLYQDRKEKERLAMTTPTPAAMAAANDWLTSGEQKWIVPNQHVTESLAGYIDTALAAMKAADEIAALLNVEIDPDNSQLAVIIDKHMTAERAKNAGESLALAFAVAAERERVSEVKDILRELVD